MRTLSRNIGDNDLLRHGKIFSFFASTLTGGASPAYDGFATSSKLTPFPSFKGNTTDNFISSTPANYQTDAHIVSSLRCSLLRPTPAHHTTMRCALVRQKCHALSALLASPYTPKGDSRLAVTRWQLEGSMN